MSFENSHVDSRLKAAITFLVFISLLTVQIPVGLCAEVTQADKNAYLKALAEAEEVTQQKISRRLLAIVPDYDRINHEILNGGAIRWEGEPGRSRVLVATFLDRNSYIYYYKDNLDVHAEKYILKKTLWVTVVPELKNFFKRRNVFRRCPPSCKRVKQLLGLHAAKDYDVLLEMWVNPKDLFRPSADPEITDHEAQVAVKISSDQWVFPDELNPFLKLDDTVLVKDAQWSPVAVPYKTWFVDRAQTVYVNGTDLLEGDPNTWGCPWTQLGYTYDWGNSKSHVGLSEFVLRIDPNKDGGEVEIRLENAYDCNTRDWFAYFRCRPDRFHEYEVLEDDAEEFDVSPEDMNTSSGESQWATPLMQ